jgi:hypothetical protein
VYITSLATSECLQSLVASDLQGRFASPSGEQKEKEAFPFLDAGVDDEGRTSFANMAGAGIAPCALTLTPPIGSGVSRRV